MIHIPGKIPIIIHPMFWIFAAFIGFIASQSFIGTFIWIGVIFVSVLFHEFGHALTACLFGRKPRIELVAFGGLTFHDGDKLPLWKQFFIILNGPVFGFLLFLGAFFLKEHMALQGVPQYVVELTFRVNLIWTILNLLPVLPLDGGQILRVLFESIFGLKGFRYALLVSGGVALVAALAAMLFQQFLPGAFFFLLAFQGFESWRRTRLLSEPDRKEELKEALEKAEKAMASGRREEARSLLEEIRTKAKQGMIHALATQYLAYIDYELGKTQEAYELLLPIRSELAPDALCLLHQTAFACKNFPLVMELSGNCYQTLPSAELALRNAYAAAFLKEAEATVGWLETAVHDGLQDVHQIAQETAFDSVRSAGVFQEFQEKNSK